MAEAENGQEKTEEATPKKREKARSEGQTARSRELVTCALIMGAALLLLLWSPMVITQFLAAVTDLYQRSGRELWLEGFAGSELYLPVLQTGVLAIIGPLGGAMLIGLVASAAVGGLNFAPAALAPKWSRLDPIKGFGRMFSQRTLVELLKSIGKVLLISATAVAVLLVFMKQLLFIGDLAPAVGFRRGVLIALLALLCFGAVLVLIAAVDVPFQLAEHSKQLKMTRQEVKDELKESEGRPEVRSRIRRAQQEMASRRMLADVPKADVIITNPEHFAVALRYDAAAGAPEVVAAGVDHLALRLRMVGREHGVPELRLPPLARALYFSTGVGEHIPAGLYEAVAQVLAYLYNLEAYRAGKLDARPALGSLAIPTALRRDPQGQPEVPGA